MCDFSLEIVESGRHWDGMTQTLKEGRNNSLSNNAMPSKVILGKKKKDCEHICAFKKICFKSFPESCLFLFWVPKDDQRDFLVQKVEKIQSLPCPLDELKQKMLKRPLKERFTFPVLHSGTHSYSLSDSYMKILFWTLKILEWTKQKVHTWCRGNSKYRQKP